MLARARAQALYARRAAAAAEAARAHLHGLAAFQEPTAGMFIWFRLTGARGVRHTVRHAPPVRHTPWATAGGRPLEMLPAFTIR